MSFQSLTRTAARSIPRVRRFYEYADKLAKTKEQLSATVGRLRSKLSAIEAKLAEAEAERIKLATELAKTNDVAEAADKERESLELQLYILTSDFQRAVSQNEQLNASLQEAERLADELRTQSNELRTQNDELRTQNQLSESNFQRAVSQNEQLNASLQEAERLADELRTQNQLSESQAAASAATESAQHKAQGQRNHDQLLGRFSIMGTELTEIRRMLRASSNGNQGNPVQLRLSYIQLLERALTGQLYGDEPMSPWSTDGYDAEVRLMGRDWPSQAHTMIGAARMSNLRALVESVLEDDIPGDLLEAGVWRGGACIHMRGILAAYNVTDRRVWVADSFCGLPPPNPKLYPVDAGDQHHNVPELAVSLEEVKSNFAKYELLDDQVVFLPGWFKDTLPSAPIKQLAILRLDGDMYQSTMETLQSLYFKVSPGGYVIVDDYILQGARRAVEDFRRNVGILEVIQPIDGAGVYWRKET